MGDKTIDRTGSEFKIISVTPTHVYALIYVRDIKGAWYELKVKIPVEKFKPVGG